MGLRLENQGQRGGGGLKRVEVVAGPMRRPKKLHLRTASDVELETEQILRLCGLFEPCHNGRNHRSLPVSKLSVRLEYSLVKCSAGISLCVLDGLPAVVRRKRRGIVDPVLPYLPALRRHERHSDQRLHALPWTQEAGFAIAAVRGTDSDLEDSAHGMHGPISCVTSAGESWMMQRASIQRYFSPKSRELLIQRDGLQDARYSNVQRGIPSSGVHSDDTQQGSIRPATMIRSFVAQLLEQSYRGYGFSCGEVGLEGVRAGNVADLCALLEWLVKYLPEGGGKTLVCIGDRIDAYENGEDGDNLRTVMELLLGLARSGDPDRVVKVLATSPKGTVSIDEAFRNDPSNFLSIERLQIVSYEEGVLEF